MSPDVRRNASTLLMPASAPTAAPAANPDQKFSLAILKSSYTQLSSFEPINDVRVAVMRRLFCNTDDASSIPAPEFSTLFHSFPRYAQRFPPESCAGSCSLHSAGLIVLTLKCAMFALERGAQTEA